jgi:sugar lactone lactonase YvrE
MSSMTKIAQRNWSKLRRPAVALAAVSLAVAGTATVYAYQGKETTQMLRREAWSNTMLWNAVVSDETGIVASGPRWCGNTGIQVARVKDGESKPFPNAEWNSWKEGEDPSSKFVNVNSLHPDGQGGVWVVDTGSPTFGGNPLPNGAKIVHIDLATGKIIRVVHFASDAAQPGSYVDDIRIHNDTAYLTDAGKPGIIILDMRSGKARRVLDGHPSTLARADRPIVIDGEILRGPDQKPVMVNSDPMELSPDGNYLFYGPLHGPWSKIPTSVLDDPSLTAEAVAAAVEPFADLPPMGGSTIDAQGNIYFSDLKDNAIRKRAVDGTISTLVQDARLHWVDAMYIDAKGRLWMPAAQIDRIALFHSGKAKIQRPIALYSIALK